MSQLNKNTTDLDALIAKANALPNAGTSEDLTAVLDAQETLISELEAELEGKAAGGGGVETCTVIANGGGGERMYYTSVVDGKICGVALESNNDQYVFSDIVCGSVIRFSGVYIVREASDGYFGDSTNNPFYIAPTTAGITATLRLVRD